MLAARFIYNWGMKYFWHSERGNVFFFIFLGIVLFALLTYVVAGTGRVGGSVGSDDKSALGATGVLDYVRNAQAVIQQMRFDGVTTTQLDFVKPGEAGFTTAPHDRKMYHPEGGGLPVLATWDELLASDAASLVPAAGIYFVINTVEDVGTTGNDLIMSFRGVHAEICKKLNKNIRNDETIPSIGALDPADLFVTGVSPVSAANCAACAGKDMLCIKDDAGVHTFYAVVQKG